MLSASIPSQVPSMNRPASNAIEQDPTPVRPSKQVGGVEQRPDQECLEDGRNCDRHGSTCTADDGEAAEHEHAVRGS